MASWMARGRALTWKHQGPLEPNGVDVGLKPASARRNVHPREQQRQLSATPKGRPWAPPREGKRQAGLSQSHYLSLSLCFALLGAWGGSTLSLSLELCQCLSLFLSIILPFSSLHSRAGCVLSLVAPAHKTRCPLGSGHDAHDCEKVGHGRRDLFRPRKSGCLPELLTQRNIEMMTTITIMMEMTILVVTMVISQVRTDLNGWNCCWRFVGGGIRAVECQHATAVNRSGPCEAFTCRSSPHLRSHRNYHAVTRIRLGGPACARFQRFRKSLKLPQILGCSVDVLCAALKVKPCRHLVSLLAPIHHRPRRNACKTS